MARRRFDNSTRNLFERIQRQVSAINGKLLSPKLPVGTREQLIKLRDDLRAESKQIKERYAKVNENSVKNESETLLKEARDYDVRLVKKY